MPQIRLLLSEASEGRLPAVCMRCDEPATVTKSKNMAWCPQWVGFLMIPGILLFPLGMLPYIIVGLILTKRAKVNAPFCDQHRGHWLYRTLFNWTLGSVTAIIGIGSFALMLNAQDKDRGGFATYLCVGSLLLFLVALIVMIPVQNSAIRPKEITDREIVLEGVSDAFIDAVSEADRERRARKRDSLQSRDEGYDDEELPRKRNQIASDAFESPQRRKKPPTDAIEEDE